MEQKHLDEIKKAVAESIEINVNGKIRVLTQKFDDYVKEDMDWKKEYEPFLKGMANVSGAAKIVVWVALGIAAVVGAIISIKNLK